MERRFAGKVVIVTGAGSGVGEATARRFVAEGARVVLVGRTREKLDRVARSLGEASTLVAALDVSDRAALDAMIKRTVARFGRIDVLVNNAGVVTFGPFVQATLEDWRHVMAIDLEGVFHATQLCIPHLVASQGSIVNVSSVSGLGGDWMMAIYNTAKGGLSNMTRSLALELASQGVRVNAVAPSLTRTAMTEELQKHPAVLAKFAQRIAMGRAAEPEEVADVIAFLASYDARFVTGVVIPVDGGLSASNGQPRIDPENDFS